MKKNNLYSYTIILILLLNNVCFGQISQFNIDSSYTSNKKATRIFVTAIWCSPCMGKYKKIVNEFVEDTAYNNLVIFDASGFSLEKLKKIEPNYYNLSKTFFIPFKFYKRSKLITFNLPDKALKRFLNSLTPFILKFKIDDFWYGDFLYIEKDSTITMKRIGA